MNYQKYYPTDILNGEGVRAVLFVSGCDHGCPGCYNKTSWNPNGGFPFTKEVEDQIIRDLNDTRIKRDGLTLTGGDPLQLRNLIEVHRLIRRVREECPGKSIWMWTGYTIDECHGLRRVIAESVDVLVDGKFVQELYDPSLKWRGSSNQNIIEIKNL